MQRVTYLVATSIDGCIARPDDTFDIFVNDGDHVADYFAALKCFDSVVMGRRTYDVGAKAGVTNPYPWLETFVVSSRLESADPNVKVVADPAPLVRSLREREGRGVYLCGGGRLAARLLEDDLIDEIVLKLNPVIAGVGIPVVADMERSTALTLVDHKVHCETGVIVIRYRVKR
ncbi:MAG: dihydrofolate reductase family protein [Labilithrix sp.]|nr:dihydrofolate reductase family protein [Labilithrix sp.]